MNTPPQEDGEGDTAKEGAVTSAADISASISFGDDEDMAAWANVSAAVTEAVLGSANDAAASGVAMQEEEGEDSNRAASRGMASEEDPMMPGPEESMDGQPATTKTTSVIQG